ncbi:MAG: hypothetical protein H5T85_08705, partial [Actinobacteria bacterium]|nr:hypothetical protein [Actinomycetota bacterium]
TGKGLKRLVMVMACKVELVREKLRKYEESSQKGEEKILVYSVDKDKLDKEKLDEEK